MKRKSQGILLLLLLPLLLVVSIGATLTGRTEGSLGTIEGTVADENGGVLPGVTVLLTRGETGESRDAVTNERGFYRFLALASGRYSLVAELSGFSAYRREGIEIGPGEGRRVDVVLRIASVEETVTVTGETPLIDSRSTSIGSTFTSTSRSRSTPTRSRSKSTSKPSSIGAQTVEPIDWVAPPSRSFDTEAYDLITDNPFQSVLDHPLSTFSIDVDRASYANVRRFLSAYQLPPKDAVRIEELVNYFDYDYPDPEGDAPFSVSFEQMECPWKSGHRLVRIGLEGRDVRPDARPPTNLVFLLDVSGSMEPENKLPLVKQSMKMLTAQLGASDRIAIVVYAGASGLVLDSTPGSRKADVVRALDRLEAGGSTNGGEGIQLAYAIAERQFIEGGVNRVILATDGDFNVGVTSRGDLVRLIQDNARKKIFLSVLGFGMDNYKDATLEQLADKGNGNYAYIDGLREARKVLVREMSGTLVTIAKDVKVQVELNPERVQAYRLIGYENRILAKEDFNDDRKDAGEIGAGHRVTALYELVPAGVGRELPSVDELKYQRPVALSEAASSEELMTVKLRYKEPEGDTSKLMSFALVDDPRSKPSPDFEFASAVAAFGMMLRESPFRGDADWARVKKLAKSGLGPDGNGYRREFLELVDLAKEVSALGTDEH
jgi:Ca-activated chloride channel homolog